MPCMLHYLGSMRAMVLRRILSAPLLLPLASVCGVLWGGTLWWLSIVACLIALICCRWRILLACGLCTAVAWLHQYKTEKENVAFERMLDTAPVPILEGTVERSLSNGCVLRDDSTGAGVVLRGESAQWPAGARIRAMVEPLPESPATISGMFDSAAWLRSQGLAATCYCTESTYLEHPFSFAAMRGLADSLRASLASRLIPKDFEADPRAQVLCALVLGDKSYSDPQTVNVFKYGGCLHIFAVSGLHVGIIAGIVYFILSRFMLRSRCRTIMLLLVTAGYVTMTGLAVPAIRAFLMLALVMLGRELKRPVSMANMWAAAALLILLLSPWQIHNAGFLLSFAVYAAIGVGMRYGMQSGAWFQPDSFVPTRIYNRRERLIVKSDLWLRGVVVMSMSAWLASLPITMGYFHTFNLYGVPVNIIITPLLLPTMLCGLLSLLPWVGAFIHSAALFCAGVLLGTVGFFADMPGAYLPMQAQRGGDSLMVYHTGYADSFCVLGNPGVIINCGNENTVRFCTEPALFHGGFRPSLLVTTQRRASCGGGSALLQESFPHLHVVQAWQYKDDIREFNTPSGKVTIIPPASDLNPTPIQNASPIVIWEGKTRRVLFIGDASLLTFERMPEPLRRADVVICGRNPSMPVSPLLVSQLMPKAQIILLPSAIGYESVELPDGEVPQPLQVGAQQPCYISELPAEPVE
ncbi:MAG: ComEC/Rec2 family competence protein [Akkermansiaceae bacterium]|nr:ComEC/Rec2 family competence protein [Akkermansiaceae bacterium]